MNLRKILRKTLRFCAVIAVILALAEIGLRFFGYGSYIIYTPDDELFWVPLPNQKGRTVAGQRVITINHDRLRHPLDLPRRADDEVRIVSFGDSVTMGWGMDDASHYTAVLERLLGSDVAPRRVRGISAGVNAYPPSLCVRRFKRLLREGHQIDVAILAYSFNRGHERLLGLEGEAKESFLDKVRLKSIVRRVALYNFLIEDLLRTAVYYRLRDHLMAGSWEVKGEKPPVAGDPRKARVELYLSNLETMRRTSADHGVKLVYLLLGSEGQDNELNDFQQALLDFGRQHGVPVVNMVEVLAGRDPAELFIDHTHPSALGHELIAQELGGVVRGLLAPGDDVPGDDVPEDGTSEEGELTDTDQEKPTL